MPIITDNRGSRMDFHYLQRVKVYRLGEEGKWVDRGTGHVSIEYLERPHVVGLVVIDEEDNETLLVHHISADDIYRRREETIIAWRDPEIATELALSFQESMGCSFIWDQICSVQRSIHFPSLGASDATARSVNDNIERPNTSQANGDALHEGSGSEVRELPQVELSTLPLILKTVTEGYIVNHIHVAELIVQDHVFLRKLLGLFKICEDVGNIEGLHLIFKIMKGIISLNSSQIFEMIFSDEYIMDVVGTLEYDPELSSRLEHRTYLREQVMFKEAMPIKDPSVLSKIHQTYRIGYIKDVILPRVLDDITFAASNSIIHSNNAAVMSALKDDNGFIHEMFTRLKSPDTPAQAKKDLVLFLQEFCSLSKSLQIVHQMRLLRNLVTEGLFDIITDALQSQDKALRLCGANILIVVLNQDPSLLRTYVTEQDGHTLLGILVKGISTEFGGDMYSQFLEIMRMLLDPYTMAGSQKDIVIEIFYDKYMDQLIDVITLACPVKGSSKLGRKSTDLDCASTAACSTTPDILSNICDFLCFCVLHHSYRIRYYFLRNNVIERVLHLTCRKEKYLVVAAVRFLRTIISRNDDFLHRHIVKNNLFDPVIHAFIANGNRYNLLNSAVLELFEYIQKENYKSLIAYLVEKYSYKLERIDYVDTFQQLKLKHEQSLDCYPPRDASVGGKDHGEFAPDRLNDRSFVGNTRKRNDDQVAEKVEDYFNEDSDDEADSGAANSSVCSQPTHAVGNGSMLDSSAVRVRSIGLVDYRDEDDDLSVPVSTSSKETNYKNLKITPSSLPTKDSVEHEAVHSPKSKRRLAKAEISDDGPEAFKKHRLHTNIKDYSASTDGDKAQKPEVKEKQDSLSCKHERDLQDVKNVSSGVELLEERDCLTSKKNMNENEIGITGKINDSSQSDASSSMSKEGTGSNGPDNGIDENNFVKDKLSEDNLGNALNEKASRDPHLQSLHSVR